MKRIAAVIFVCLIAQPAWAGWVVTYRDAETGARSQEYYDSGKANLGEVIYADGRIISIDRGSKAYWQGTPDQFCKAFKAQMQQMRSMMPAQYRPKPISQRKVTRKKIGSKSIAGYSATGYEFYVDGMREKQVWVSSDSGLSGIIDFENSMSKKMKCLEETSKAELESSALYKKTTKGKFVLKDSSREVISVKKKSISSSHFEAPSGYKRFSDYQKFYDYIAAHQSDGGSSSMGSVSPSPPSRSQHQRPPSARRDRAEPTSRGEPETRQESSGEEGMPGMDDLKEGVGDMLKSIW